MASRATIALSRSRARMHLGREGASAHGAVDEPPVRLDRADKISLVTGVGLHNLPARPDRSRQPEQPLADIPRQGSAHHRLRQTSTVQPALKAILRSIFVAGRRVPGFIGGNFAASTAKAMSVAKSSSSKTPGKPVQRFGSTAFSTRFLDRAGCSRDKGTGFFCQRRQSANTHGSRVGFSSPNTCLIWPPIPDAAITC